MNQLCSGWTADRRGCPTPWCPTPWCPICRAGDPPPEPRERIAVPTGDFLLEEDMRG